MNLLKLNLNLSAGALIKTQKFQFGSLSEPKMTGLRGPPDFFFNFRVLGTEKSWGAFADALTPLTPKNGLWPTD